MRLSGAFVLAMTAYLLSVNLIDGGVVKRSTCDNPPEYILYRMIKFLRCYQEHLNRLISNSPQALNDLRVLLTSLGLTDDDINSLMDLNFNKIETVLLNDAEDAIDSSISFSSCPCNSGSSSEPSSSSSSSSDTDEKSCSDCSH